MSVAALVLGGFAGACVLMAVVWAIAVRLKNAGIVDVAWSASFTGLAAFYVIGAGHGSPRGWIVLAMTAIWSLRLAVYLGRRVTAEHPREDGRYAELRRDWASRGLGVDARFFWFFEAQALAAFALSTPMLVAAANPTPGVGAWEWAGMAIWATGVIGEATADAQLGRFKRQPANRGRTMQEGLWRYSRHPNYFFEWVVWIGFFLFALGSPLGWTTVYCPIVMLYILLFVTGVPAAEAASLRSRGDEFRAYQATTSRFVPWFRRAS